MAEEGQDPFGRILKCCQLTESQQAKLLNCTFARDSENVTDSIPLTQYSSMTQSEDDHIVVLTAPESQISLGESILEQDSAFHTPPEHHSRSHLSSSEDQNPNVDDRRRQALDDGPESKRIRSVSGDSKTEIEGDDGVHITEVIDLSDSEIGGENCDSSRSLKGKAVEECAEMPKDGGERIQVLDDEQESKRVRGDEYVNSQTFPLGGQTPNERMCKLRDLEAGMDNEPESNRIRAVAGDSKTGETEMGEDDGVHSNEVIDLSDSERAEGGGLVKAGVELGEIGGENCDSSGSLKGKAIEECTEMSKDGGERIEELRDGRMEDNDVVEEVGLFGMVDKLTAIFGFPGAGEHVDFLETAKEKGMVFSKPRWQQES